MSIILLLLFALIAISVFIILAALKVASDSEEGNAYVEGYCLHYKKID